MDLTRDVGGCFASLTLKKPDSSGFADVVNYVRYVAVEVST